MLTLQAQQIQRPIVAASSAAVVTGRSHTNCRQTYAADRPSTSGRSSSSGAHDADDPPASTATARTAPGDVDIQAARRSSADDPTTAISTGPARSAVATASPHPAARG